MWLAVGAFGVGVGFGAWVTWLVMRRTTIQASPTAEKDAVQLAPLPAQATAADAAEDMRNASDSDVDARVAELVQLGQGRK